MNNLDDEFSYIPRKEIRHNKHLEEKRVWEELKTKARAVNALKRAKRKVSNEANG